MSFAARGRAPRKAATANGRRGEGPRPTLISSWRRGRDMPGCFPRRLTWRMFAQMLLGRGQYDGATVLSPPLYAVLRGMAGARCKRIGRLSQSGWECAPISRKSRAVVSPQAFGHGGLHGDGPVIDPELRSFSRSFSSNRVIPNGKGEVQWSSSGG